VPTSRSVPNAPAMSHRDLPIRMGRAQRRAEDREASKRKQGTKGPARDPAASRIGDEHLETQDETARRIYRAGGEPERGKRTKRQVSEKPLKWWEGRQ